MLWKLRINIHSKLNKSVALAQTSICIYLAAYDGNTWQIERIIMQKGKKLRFDIQFIINEYTVCMIYQYILELDLWTEYNTDTDI